MRWTVPRSEPLKEILSATRQLWDQDGVRSAVRTNFAKVLSCRTEALGSEVYASDTEQKIVHHTCKFRACPSCGHRATRLWQREMWATLPDVQFTGVVFTMPDILWPIFQRNRHLSDDLPALGAAVIKEWAKNAHGIVPMLMVIRHTFGRHLNFNPHLHILVSAGGLRILGEGWVSGLSFDRAALMRRWRYALITYLRVALQRGLLHSERTPQAFRAMLTSQYERWWSVNVQPCSSKEHFLRYAGRYVRRPPLAQYRILEHTQEKVSFRTQDHKLKREVVTQCTPLSFTELLADQVSEHYKHGIRHFGLLAPRSKGRTFGLIFAQLKQTRHSKPPRLAWAHSIECEFGIDPLLDSKGELMRLVSRRRPILAKHGPSPSRDTES